jgi:hypothetical protein
LASIFTVPLQRAPEHLSLTLARLLWTLRDAARIRTVGFAVGVVVVLGVVVLGVVVVGVVVTAAGATVSDSDCVAVGTGEPVPVTCTVNVEVPDPVGIPEITPVCESRLNPAGRLPDDSDHV